MLYLFTVEFACEHPNVYAHDSLQFTMETIHIIIRPAALSVNGDRLPQLHSGKLFNTFLVEAVKTVVILICYVSSSNEYLKMYQ